MTTTPTDNPYQPERACSTCDWPINTLGYLICGNRLSAHHKRLVGPLHTCPQHEVLPDPYAAAIDNPVNNVNTVKPFALGQEPLP
jgi:hypothetical protein